MKKIILLTSLLLFFTGSAWASTFYYDDIYANWPGYFIDPRDEIGIPQINVVTVNIENNYLKYVEINMKSSYRIPWDIGPNDPYFDALFINTNWNGTYGDYQSWDYYIRDDTQIDNSDGKLYTVSTVYNYIFATGTDLRAGHPAGIEPTYLTEISGILDGVNWTPNTLRYSFKDNKILIEDKFVIGWSVWCANDVFLTQVPEPGILILLGIGLSAVGLVARRYKKI